MDNAVFVMSTATSCVLYVFSAKKYILRIFYSGSVFSHSRNIVHCGCICFLCLREIRNLSAASFLCFETFTFVFRQSDHNILYLSLYPFTQDKCPWSTTFCLGNNFLLNNIMPSSATAHRGSIVLIFLSQMAFNGVTLNHHPFR